MFLTWKSVPALQSKGKYSDWFFFNESELFGLFFCSLYPFQIDVYSFGVLLCEMCVRELPEPQNREGQVAMVTNHGFRGLIRRCIQTEPDRRPCMEEIIENLEST